MRQATGFWDGQNKSGEHVGGFGAFEVPEYHVSDEAKRLREMRVNGAVYRSLNDAAKLLGMRPSELSGLEQGSLVPREPLLWETWAQLLSAESRAGQGEGRSLR